MPPPSGETPPPRFSKRQRPSNDGRGGGGGGGSGGGGGGGGGGSGGSGGTHCLPGGELVDGYEREERRRRSVQRSGRPALLPHLLAPRAKRGLAI